MPSAREVLAGGASTQSRARRPLPPEFEGAVCLSRGPAEELWRLPLGHLHEIACTWVFDQGGPILGYQTMVDSPMSGPGGIASADEVDAASLLIDTVGEYCTGKPMVRFFANGSDALDASVRLARADTGRDNIISIGYHGSSIVFATPPQNKGVPWGAMANTVHLAFGDINGLRQTFTVESFQPFACIVVEVPSTDGGAGEYLAECRRLCDQHGALLVLDEVVTGFRLGLGGAAEHYDVKADILCYGKAMSNGRPIAALLGPADVMARLDRDVFFSNTMNGDPPSCVQIIATIEYLRGHEKEVYDRIWAVGQELHGVMRPLGINIAGHAPRTFLDMPEDKRREFCVRMVRHGILMDRPNYATTGHTDTHIRKTAEAARRVMEEMA